MTKVINFAGLELVERLFVSEVVSTDNHDFKADVFDLAAEIQEGNLTERVLARKRWI